VKVESAGFWAHVWVVLRVDFVALWCDSRGESTSVQLYSGPARHRAG
jgi:hypothetical protein